MLSNSFRNTWGMTAALIHIKGGLGGFFLLMRSGVLSCRRVPQPFGRGMNSVFREGTVISWSLLIPPVSRTTPHGTREAGRA